MIYWFDKKRGFDLPAGAAGREICGTPAADIYQSHCGWLIKFELAGVRQGDISINAEGRTLTISGIRRDLSIKEDWSHYSMEIAYSRFKRTIEMSCNLDRADIRVEMHDGMLMVNVTPKEKNDDSK
jgi:HSP20 family molecular chaperone IbpA